MGHAANLFFMGKGGVGKSTSASLNAVFLAQNACNVLLVSLDPAHNLSDIFGMKLTHRPTKILPGLKALEIDQDRWIRAYLKDVQHQVRNTYSYLSAFNLDHYFKVLRHSPGLEEYALLMAFRYFQEKYSGVDYLIFDMPPTALALKFFALPTLSLIWIEQLSALRTEIIRKKELITRIKMMNKEVERDKILLKIDELRDECQEVKEIFQDRTRTRIHLVMNSDQLSHAESRRILDELSAIDIRIHCIVHNKMQPLCPSPQTDTAYAAFPMLNFPYSKMPLIGIESLHRFINDIEHQVARELHACHMPHAPLTGTT